MKKIFLLAIISLTAIYSCKDYYDTKNNPVSYGKTYMSIDISTDKSSYQPGETVNFWLREKIGNQAKIRYSYLGNVLHEENLTGTSWSWKTPLDDFRGYMVDIYEMVNGQEVIYHSIAVDVSSNWKKFPRYGFLSSYGNISEEQIEKNIAFLSRYHINGVQFYDWMHDHQRPLAGTVENPSSSWPDLIGRTNHLQTVRSYIGESHRRGMKAMFYNLAFGALNNAAGDGVREDWYLYKDANRTEKDKHQLDAPFRSSIYLVNPGNTQWQAYLAQRHQDVYKVFDFDGYHIDQLGYRGNVYDFNGALVNLNETYPAFIRAMKAAQPNKSLVMNAVSGYGQNLIANEEVDFLYTEVWDETKTFAELAEVITNNATLSGNTKNSVFAAYMNYGKSGNVGYLNKSGILLANAVIFAFGGAHLELGEHYLANEYFPNSNLQATSDIKQALVNYYDFLVAYQNILRDGGSFTTSNILQNTNGKMVLNNWQPNKGQVSFKVKEFGDKDVIHFLNFSNANSLEWRDTNGTQTEPSTITNADIVFQTARPVKKVWLASPDFKKGVPVTLSHTQAGNEVRFSLPELKYWDMVVVEY